MSVEDVGCVRRDGPERPAEQPPPGRAASFDQILTTLSGESRRFGSWWAVDKPSSRPPSHDRSAAPDDRTQERMLDPSTMVSVPPGQAAPPDVRATVDRGSEWDLAPTMEQSAPLSDDSAACCDDRDGPPALETALPPPSTARHAPAPVEVSTDTSCRGETAPEPSGTSFVLSDASVEPESLSDIGLRLSVRMAIEAPTSPVAEVVVTSHGRGEVDVVLIRAAPVGGAEPPVEASVDRLKRRLENRRFLVSDLSREASERFEGQVSAP